MIEQTTGYGFSMTVALPYERAVERVREELAKEGFGVLTEMDVRATLQKKLDVDFRPYIILGACNPPLAHRALSTERDIGLLLPCNVVVYAGDREGTSVVTAMDPQAVLSLAAREELAPLGVELKERMLRVLEGVASGSA